MIKKLFQGLLVLLITAVLIVFCEGTLRVLYPKKVKKVHHDPQKLAFVFHPRYLVSLKPSIERNYRLSARNGGGLIHWQTNRQSFRGRELKLHPDLRIMVYGDSNVQAMFTILENTFPYRLESRLKQVLNRDIEVINAGVVGFGPDQYLLRFGDEVDVYHPNLVIFVVFADNDFGDLIRNRLFDVDASGRLIESGFQTTVDQELQWQPIRDLLANSWLLSESTDLLRRVTGKRPPTELETLIAINKQEYEVYAAHRPRYFSTFADHYDADLALFPSSPAAKSKLALMNAVLRKARELADSKRVDFMVLILPSAKDLTANQALNYRQFSAYPEYRKNTLSSSVEQFCVANRIPYVNLYVPFVKNNAEKLYFYDRNDHWNDAGQDLAAQEATQYIIARFFAK